KSSGETPKPLEQNLMGEIVFDRIPPEKHRNDAFFVDKSVDDLRRSRPNILPPTEYQVDFFPGVMLSYNFVKGADGERRQIYVVRQAKNEKNQTAQRINQKVKEKKATPPAKTGPGGGGPAGPGMGGPGGGGPGMGGPGPGGGGPGMPGGGGPGMPGGGGPGMGVGGGASQGGVASSESVKTIEAIELKKFLDDAGKAFVPAQFIRPLQCVIVQASIPWKAQLEAYKRALHYETLGALQAVPTDLPKFEGIKVQRKIYYPNGKSSEWMDYDWAKKYEDPIYIEKVDEDQVEDEDLKHVVPPEDTELFVPY